MIRLDDVSKQFGPDLPMVVNALSLEVAEGEYLAIIGESGSGKTTTLKLINRLEDPTVGAVYVNGRNIAETSPVALRRNIGYVFQGIGLFPHYTVFENVAIVPRLLRWDEIEVAARVVEMLGLVGLDPDEYRERLPAELSGGQQQRVGVARALAARPEVMLMDEPFGALDPITRASLQDEFLRIRNVMNLTVVMVTHDMTEALLLADRIAVMKDGEVLQVGTPHELLAEPEHPYVRELVEMPKQRSHRLEALLEAES